MKEPLHLFSRSDVEEYWTCPRASYWKRIYKGRGLEPVMMDMAYVFGIALHHATAAIIQGEDIETAAKTAAMTLEVEAREAGCPQWILNQNGDPEQFFREQRCLMEGMVYGWAREVLPSLKMMGTLEVVETETVYQKGKLAMMATPDLLILPHGMEEYYYIEWKTCASASPGWFMSWTTAPQFAANALTVKQTLGKEIDSYIVVGLVKGSWSDGWQHTPFCWGWRHEDGRYAYQFKDARTKGWSRFPVWEYPGGVRQWVEDMPSDILGLQFPRTVPIPVNMQMVEAFERQTFEQEAQVMYGKQNLALGGDCVAADLERTLDVVFPQHFKNCNPVIGRQCWAYELCWQPAVAMDPLAGGKYQWRTSHHEMEQMRLKVKEMK